MAGRSTRAGGRSTPVDTVNPQQLQQPQCEEAHLQTPPQTHQGLSPPRTRRDSTLHNDWNGDDIPMADNIPTADNTFHPTFQMPHSAYSTFNAAFPPRSTGNVDRAALNNIVEQSFQQFWFDFAETLFPLAVDSLSTVKAQTAVSFYLMNMARANINLPSPDQTGTADSQNVDS